ncbi:MAG TPA: CCA tRNA nucleotidyltransferase [Tepidisphaeraceae bacterium]|jgi:poly(A) polymerase|nr:CCA tRNA nucleotidyltransferase [Tepidisphaeraceae bacterium]
MNSKPPCTRDDALIVIKRLREAGHTAYFAGGCVRDALLGLEAKDWDVATDAPPPRVRELFPAAQAVGAAFGVILVRIGRSTVEVATFRADGAYEDGRRPSSVRFTSAEEDAQRRDFTINGLFLDPIEDRIIDFVGGRQDLSARIIRAIGSPAERFGEDHLRMIRAVRFAARFGFEIEPATTDAIRSLATRIKGISPERIGDELRLMLTPPTRTVAWTLLWDLHLSREIFRFLPKVPERLDFNRSVFLNLNKADPISMGLSLAAAVLCIRLQTESIDVQAFLTKPEISRCVRAMRQALRISNDESEEMAQTLANLQPLLQSDPPTVAQKKRFLAQPTSGGSRHLMQALVTIDLHRDRIAALQRKLAELSEKGNVAPAPLLDGDDLIAAGFPPGPRFRQILEAVYDAQLEERISTKDHAIQLAKSL